MIQTYIFAARSDYNFISLTLPSLLEMCTKAQAHVSLVLDTKKTTGVLSKTIKQSEFQILHKLLEDLAQKYGFTLMLAEYEKQQIRSQNKLQFNYPLRETHCFRGYPINGSFRQFLDTDSKYILHLDCDMIFYESPYFSWIQEGISIMEENEDILCVLPRGGPPSKNGLLHQGTTDYSQDEKRGLYLFKNFTSRHYLIHRERFLSLLPLKPLWLSWREPIKSRLFGNGKMLCWETMIEEAFYKILPQIIDSVNSNEFPDEQRGHFDLRLRDWKLFLN